MKKDFLEFLGAWLFEGFVFHGSQFQTALILAFVGGVFLWVAAYYFPWLFNRQFRRLSSIHVTAALASVVSMVLLLLLFCSRHAKAALEREIDRWSAELASGATPETAHWHKERALETWQAVRALNNGDLADTAEPTTGGANLILTKPDSVSAMARIYASSAVENFSVRHPWLSRILALKSTNGRPGWLKRLRNS